MPFIARPASGQIIDPAWGTLVADAVVMRFTTAAQRTSQLTAPAANQLTMRDDRPGVIERWSGTAWVETTAPRELAYAEITANKTVAQAAEGAADSVVAAPAVTFDGTTAVLIEFFSAALNPAAVAAASVNIWLYQDGASIGRLAVVSNPAAGQLYVPVHAVRRLTPTAGAHTYVIAATQNLGNGLIAAGAGGAGSYPPAFIRIARAT